MLKNPDHGPRLIVDTRRVYWQTRGKVLPDSWARRISASRLQREKFKKVGDSEFERCFSGVLTLWVSIPKGQSKYYRWIMNDTAFRRLIRKLQRTKDCIDSLTDELSSLYTRLGDLGHTENEEFMGKYRDAAESVDMMKADFLEEYQDFLSVCSPFPNRDSLLRSEWFFFDACETSGQLQLHLKFVSLFKDVFLGMTVSKGPPRAIGILEVPKAFLAYSAALATIKRIRQSHRKLQDLEKLKAEFPMIDEKWLRHATDEPREGNWVFSAEDLALEYAESKCFVSRAYLRKMMRKEKLYAAYVRMQVKQFESPEQILTGESPIELLPFVPSTGEESAPNVILQTLRDGIALAGPLSKERLPFVQGTLLRRLVPQ